MRRDSHTDATKGEHLAKRCEDLVQKAAPILERAPVLVRAPVGAVVEELVKEVAVSRVELDGVKSGSLCVAGCVAIVLDEAGHFVQAQGPRGRIWQLLTGERGARFIGDGNIARRHRRSATGLHSGVVLERGVRATPGVPKLQGDESALCVHRINHLLPAFRLLSVPDARHAVVQEALRAHEGGLRDQQAARGGALRVVDLLQAVDRCQALVISALPRERRQHYSVGQLQVA
mmetsp:Transcript_6840/g.21984  ORF Transcript_6840/g.21984 Transcript_6840/m.21984 type:complete len:232 (-) Transcript_6840:6-701(-)